MRNTVWNSNVLKALISIANVFEKKNIDNAERCCVLKRKHCNLILRNSACPLLFLALRPLNAERIEVLHVERAITPARGHTSWL